MKLTAELSLYPLQDQYIPVIQAFIEAARLHADLRHDMARGRCQLCPVAICNAFSFGIGARLPIGENDASRDGIVLAEDLQPSTGAFAGLIWVFAARALNDSRGARVYVSATHTYNGENDRDYQFGHSTTASLGGSYQTQTPWGLNLELLFRHAERDQRAAVSIPNTGGQWLDLVPAVQYHINESVALRASGKIPLARDLNDQLQFTAGARYDYYSNVGDATSPRLAAVWTVNEKLDQLIAKTNSYK